MPRDALVLLSWEDPCECDFIANSENINLLIFRTQLFSPLCVASVCVHMDMYVNSEFHHHGFSQILFSEIKITNLGIK